MKDFSNYESQQEKLMMNISNQAFTKGLMKSKAESDVSSKIER